MKEKRSKHYVIIGNGVAGINAALTIREKLKQPQITVISAETEFYYSRTALMYIAMGMMECEDTEPYERNYYSQKNIDLVYGKVEEINTEKKSVIVNNHPEIPFDSLLLATGAIVAAPSLPGIDLKGVVGFISFQDLEEIKRLIKTARKAIVVGGGLIGIEMCEVFNHCGLDVTFVIRDTSYWQKALSYEEGLYVQEHMQTHGISLVTGEELSEIIGENGSVKGIRTKSNKTLPCDILGIATGVRPETTLAKEASIACNNGILTDWNLKTSVQDIYAAGDCVEIQSPSGNYIRTIWYSARDMGKVAGKNMSGENIPYVPGEWYNSAKFFDKEYTVVGRFGKLRGNESEYLYQDKNHSIRIILEENRIMGFSIIGSRWDHSKLLHFIREQKELDYFLHHYKEAQFDPEFHANRIG
ncbi:MAG: NAD(P)/FAD-dependent oxidoreductase [Spirochaetales bacterium]|nr:NAD(P)/FAD-dependent oxidoreductase [Spirochaetales bacterium]